MRPPTPAPRLALLGAALLAIAAPGAGPAAAAEARVTAAAAHVGSWGLEVSIGPGCSGPDQLDLSGAAPLEGTHTACVQLTAQQVAVGAGGAVLQAGEMIALADGFTVPTGVALTAALFASYGGDFAAIDDPSPVDESIYHATFSLDHAGLSLGAGDAIEHFTAYSAAGDEVFRLVLEPDGSGGAQLHLAARQNGGGWIETAPGQEIALPGGWTQIEVSWAASDGAGELRVAVGGGALTGLTALVNDAYTVESVRWGAVGGSVAASSGLLRLDAFNSWR